MQVMQVTFSQEDPEARLLRAYDNARSDSERVVYLGKLSEYYYAYKDFNKGDSIIEKQIITAEGTLSKSLTLKAYFNNAAYRSANVITKDRLKDIRSYIERAYRYAKANGFTDYAAMASSNLSVLFNADGKTEEAFKYANQGFTTAYNTDNDSARVVCAVQLGNIYLQRSDVLTAFKTFTNAQNMAMEREDETLLPPVLNATALLYKKLGNEEIARNYAVKSLSINKKNHNQYGQIADNIFLAKLTNNYAAGKQYLQEALSLADASADLPMKIEAERILFLHMLLQESPQYMLGYLETRPELKQVFTNTGPEYLTWMFAEIYLYGGQPDTALYYFQKAEKAFDTGYDLTSKKNFFGEYAYCLQTLNHTGEAIEFYRKSLSLSRSAGDLQSLQQHTGSLKKLYEQEGDYKLAYEYNVLYDHYKDSVDLLGKEKDIALLEIQNEEKEQQRKAELAARELQRRYNLQYMLITIIVATVFVLLIMVGMFRVSAFTIRLMGFLSLIFFFEFIILVLDNKIHHLTHGEPWKVWLIKIGIISFLLPVHHYLEHKLIHYLLSRHLIKVRSRLSPAGLFRTKKKPLPEERASEEEKKV